MAMITPHWKPDAGELSQRLAHVMAELGVSRDIAALILTDEATYAEHFNAGQDDTRAAFHRLMRPVDSGENRGRRKPVLPTLSDIKKRFRPWARRKQGAEFTINEARDFLHIGEHRCHDMLFAYVNKGLLLYRKGDTIERGRHFFRTAKVFPKK
jgi:hypothetical protein